jgi:hypothetical protein
VNADERQRNKVTRQEIKETGIRLNSFKDIGFARVPIREGIKSVIEILQPFPFLDFKSYTD